MMSFHRNLGMSATMWLNATRLHKALPWLASQQHGHHGPSLAPRQWAVNGAKSTTWSVRTLQPAQQSNTGRSSSLTCRAAAAAGGDDTGPVQLPDSREQAVQQACAAIAAQLTGGKKAKSRGFAGAGCTKFSVEIPVADGSAGAALALARELVQGLSPQLRPQFTVVACNEAVAAAGAGAGAAPVVSLQQCLREGRQLSGCLLIVGPSKQQIADVSRLLAAWRGPGAVLLNAEWWADDYLPEEHKAFAATFEAIYSFVPLSIRAFVTTQEGAVFKFVRSGAPSSAPWRIYALDGKAWDAVGRMQRRPSQADIETAFYNMTAAKSPITAGVKFFKGLVPSSKK